MYYIYILSNEYDNVLYIGMTNDLLRRMEEHLTFKTGFTGKYNCNKLVYFESFNSPQEAIDREKQLKKWNRKKKDALIDAVNPERENLIDTL